MTEPEAISRLKLTLPKSFFEVCHFLKRESALEFLAQDNAGQFTRQIQISRQADSVSIYMTVDDFTFEANNLCCFVDKIKVKDESALEAALEDDETPTETTTATAAASGDDNQQRSTVEHTAGGSFIRKPGSLSKIEPNNSASKGGAKFTESPSGRRIRRPARYLHGADDDDDDGQVLGSIGEPMDDDDPVAEPSFFPTAVTSALIDDGLMEAVKVQSGVSDLHIVVEKQGGNKSTKSANRRLKKAQSESGVRSTAGKGKKRPNYKREANIECKICHNMYKDELSLISHVQKLHPSSEENKLYISELKEKAKVACKICGKVLGNKRNEVSSHMLRVHGKDDDFISRCEECGAEFRRTFLLKEHMRRQHPKHERILCHLCPASFKLKEYLTEHLKYTHNKQFKWQCDICGKMTSSPKNLRRHKKLHEGLTYQCPICNKLFSEAGNMRRHIQYVHNTEGTNKSKCPHCPKDFSNKSNLMQHISLVHMKTTPFYCDICKKYFPRKKTLVEHAALVHPGVPILSTTKSNFLPGQVQPSALSTINSVADAGVLSEDQQQYTALSGVEGSDAQPTIIVQDADGTEHVLVASQGLDGQGISVNQLPQVLAEQQSTQVEELQTRPTSINVIGGDVASSMTDSSLSALAQQALAAFEAGGGLDTAEFGSEQYMNVIADDGQEFRVQIVRKDSSDIQAEQSEQLETIYVEGANVVAGEGSTIQLAEGTVANVAENQSAESDVHIEDTQTGTGAPQAGIEQTNGHSLVEAESNM